MTVAKKGRSTGPAPVPVEVKRARGNPGKRALTPEAKVTRLPGSRTPPKPPVPLGARGRALWSMAWREAAAWLAPSDVYVLAQLCESLDEQEKLRRVVMAEGDWRQRSALRALDKQITEKLQLLGFTPADRSRLGVGEVRIEDDLESFRKHVAG